MKHEILTIGKGLVFLAGLLAGSSAKAEDWPRWRGPRGDGTWNGPKLLENWPQSLNRVWSVPVGGGYAGVTVADGRLFTLDRQKIEAKDKEAPDGTERVFCLDAATGKPLWAHSYPTRYGTLGGYANGPRAAPTVYEGRVYTLGAVGHLFCFDAATGKIIWSKNMVDEHKARIPEWGFAASPVVDGDRVLVHTGAEPNGSVIAFHRLTGAEVWRSLPDKAGYATPILIDAPSGRQVVVWTPENVHGLNPETGAVFWSVPYKVTYDVSIAAPIYRDGIVFVTGYWEGAKAIRLGPSPGDAKVIWEDNRHLRGLMAQPLYRDGHGYSIDKSQGLVCFDLKTGKKVWDDGNRLTPRSQNPHASFVWMGDEDKVLAVNSNGELILARLNPEGYRELARRKALDGKVWGHPAFAGRHIFIKSDGAGGSVGGGPQELACLELPTAAAETAKTRPRYETRADHDPNGTGRFYMGREIALVMGHLAAGWLDRPEREQEEKPSKMLETLKIKAGDVVADVGAGSGYFTFRLSKLVGPKGKVLAVDIQPEMLTLIKQRMKERKLENIVPVLGAEADPKLPADAVDLILLVDVYHEFSHPFEMTEAMVKALKPGGRLVFVEYRLEDPEVPIKLVHKMSQAQVIKEMRPHALRWVKTHDVLPWQHIIVFEKIVVR